MTRPQALAHFSDLHIGARPSCNERARSLVAAALISGIDHVLVTGDVTHRGRQSEYETFLEIFEPLMERGRLLVVPGNHDRTGDDVARWITAGVRVCAFSCGQLYCVLLDSTGPHNRFPLAAHGLLTSADFDALDEILDRAPPDALVVVAMHHHPYPLPEESTLERLSAWLGLPFTAALHEGMGVLEFLLGRCDLVLHGHRHVPTSVTLGGPRPLRVLNAGSSTELGCYRVLEHRLGRLIAEPHWVDARLVDGNTLPITAARPHAALGRTGTES